MRGGWTALGATMAFGAAYDAAFGVAILAFTRPAAGLLGLEVPPDPIYLKLNGVFLLLLAGLYALPAWDPPRYHAIAPVSAGGRGMGFVLFVGSWSTGGADAFLALGGLDLAIGVVTLLVWVRARRIPPSI